MSDALRANGQRLPDGFRTGGLAGVVGQPQSSLGGFGVKSVESLRAAATLVAAESDADDGGILRAHFGCFAEDAFGFLDRKMAHGVEDPIECEAKLAFAALAGPFQAGKDGLEGARIEVAPHIDDAYRNIDLRVDDALRGELLDHAPCGQFVVLGIDEAPGYRLEALNEGSEVVEIVERLGLV